MGHSPDVNLDLSPSLFLDLPFPLFLLILKFKFPFLLPTFDGHHCVTFSLTPSHYLRHRFCLVIYRTYFISFTFVLFVTAQTH